MDSMGIDPRQAAHQAGQVAREVGNSEWVHTLARLGFVAIGVVYILVGGLAAAAGLGRGGSTTDKLGAIETIYQQPLGKMMLAAVALGLVGYVIWCIVRAVLDPDREGNDPKGLALRTGYFVAGLIYAGLALAAINLVTGSGDAGASSDDVARDWTTRLLDTPVGVPLVVLAGLVAVGLGLAQFYKAYSAKFLRYLDLSQAGPQGRPAIEWLGRIGYAARGVVFIIIGIFFIQAAVRHNPGEAKGLGGALNQLALTPLGPLLLAAVALGLVLFGLYCLAEGWFRVIRRSP